MAAITKGRVLVVDDEIVIRQSLALVLSQSGFEPVLAATVDSAMAQHTAAACDLLLVDKNLPGESGLDLIRRIRANGDSVPIVVMTGFGSVDSAIQGLHLHICAYIEKPFDDIFAVATLVEQIIRRGHESRAENASDAINHFRKAKAALHELGNPAQMRALKILVVSASPADRDVVAHCLGRRDDSVDHCGSAAAGFAAVARCTPDLVFVDEAVTSPDLFSFIEQLRAHAVRSVWVAITHQPSLSTVMGLIRLDVRAILEKLLDEHQ